LKFRIGVLIAIALLFLLELPRYFVSMILAPVYYPLVQLESFVRDVQNMREELDFAFQMSPFERRVFVNAPIYDDPSSPTTMVLPFGTMDGVSYGDPVVVYSCVAGKVVHTSADRSMAITIYNPELSIPVYDGRSKLLSRVMGGNPPLMEHLEGQDVKRGDTLYTSGLEGMFPEGLVVGHVGEVVSEEGGVVIREVIPACDLHRLNRFHIIRRGWD